jgi:hypothetical protein
MSEQTQNNETAEIIKDLQSKPQVPIKGNTADFLKKFSRNPDGSQIQQDTQIDSDSSEDVVEDVIDSDNTEKKPLIQMEKKKPGFVQKQIEENKRLKEELEKYKNQEIPKYTSKITELEELVKNSQTTAEANHYQEQLNKINEQKSELEANLTKEIQELRSKVEFHDITQSPDFQEKYVAPIQNAYLEAKEIIGDDAQLLAIFNRGTAANAAIYAAQTEEAKREALRERKEAFQELTNSLDTYNQVRFVDAIKDFEKATQSHAFAVSDWHTTKMELTRKAKEKEVATRSQFINTWRDSYKRQAEEVDSEIAIPEQIESFMKDKGITFDTARDEAIALAATQQSNDPASVDEMNRLIHQGRAYKKLQALVKAQSEMLKEKDDFINKLKGASKIEGSPKSTTDSQQRRISPSEGLMAKLSKFTPQGRMQTAR